MTPKLALASVLVLAGLSAGCTSDQMYASGRAYQRNQCEHMPDQNARERCLRDASMSHDEYKREADSAGPHREQ